MSATKENTRAESGPMRFGDDWNGVFVRGDNAMYYAHELQIILNELRKLSVNNRHIGSLFSGFALEGLVELLNSSNQFNENNDVQVLKEFQECVLEEEK